MRYDEILVTPAMAKTWLETSNKHNRNLSMATVMRYAADMRGGYWQLNGEPIQFSESGELKNGQHRLSAVVMAGVPVMMSVLFDVPDNANIYDSHMKRSEANALQLAGINISKNEISIAKYLYTSVLKRTDAGSGQVIAFSRNEAESLRETNKIVSSTGKSVMKKAACCSAAWIMLTNGYDHELMRRFFKIGETGYYDSGEESAIVLRNMILTKRLTTANRSEQEKLFKATCKALVDFSLKKPRKVMYRDFEFENIDCFTGTTAESILRKYLN